MKGGFNSKVSLLLPTETGTVVEGILGAAYWDRMDGDCSNEEALTVVARVMQHAKIYPCLDRRCPCQSGGAPDSLWKATIDKHKMNARLLRLNKWKIGKLELQIQDQAVALNQATRQKRSQAALVQSLVIRSREQADLMDKKDQENAKLRKQVQRLESKLEVLSRAGMQDFDDVIEEYDITAVDRAATSSDASITSITDDADSAAAPGTTASPASSANDNILYENGQNAPQVTRYILSSSPVASLEAEFSSTTDDTPLLTPEPMDVLTLSHEAETLVMPFKITTKSKKAALAMSSFWNAE